jgi:hypothetical protein
MHVQPATVERFRNMPPRPLSASCWSQTARRSPSAPGSTKPEPAHVQPEPLAQPAFLVSRPPRTSPPATATSRRSTATASASSTPASASSSAPGATPTARLPPRRAPRRAPGVRMRSTRLSPWNFASSNAFLLYIRPQGGVSGFHLAAAHERRVDVAVRAREALRRGVRVRAGGSTPASACRVQRRPAEPESPRTARRGLQNHVLAARAVNAGRFAGAHSRALNRAGSRAKSGSARRSARSAR